MLQGLVYHCVVVLVLAPRGAKLPVDITKAGDTLYRVEFIPSVVGENV